MSEDLRIYICTRDGDLVGACRGAHGWSAQPVLRGAWVQCVTADGPRVLAGTRDQGLFLSDDAGAGWERVELSEPAVFSVAISAADGTLYAGTEPSRLFASADGREWTELEVLQRIPSRDRWSFPPRPWTHHVHAIAPAPADANTLLVGIELGGLMYTDDGGASFSDHRPGAKRDTHHVAWHPRADGLAYQAAGDGTARSSDGGRTWHAVDDGRDLGYCWALALDPADPDRWYASAASGPGAAHRGRHARGRLYRCDRETWTRLNLPTETMPYALVVTATHVIAGMADGQLLCSEDHGDGWTDTGVQVGPLGAMAAASGLSR
ncbi:MAG TPA: hypothetical protein VFW09_01150 [Solirubrobacteraceae bacterium]|nr:hypothetical protein [Solirubrobacteraceae bacterium]